MKRNEIILEKIQHHSWHIVSAKYIFIDFFQASQKMKSALYYFLFCIVDIILYYTVCLVTHSCPTLCDPMDCSPPGFSVHEDSPGKNTGVGFHALLQGIVPTQGSNSGLPHCRQILYQLSHWESPNIILPNIYPQHKTFSPFLITQGASNFYIFLNYLIRKHRSINYLIEASPLPY